MTILTYSPSRRERKKRETRERIITTALELFGRKGIENTTVDEIAAAADIGKGTIYNYFRTKEDIVVAFVMEIERGVQAELPRLVRKRGSLESILTRVVQLQLDPKEPHYAFVRVFLAQMCAKATSQTDWVQEIQTVMDPPLIELFAALQQRGLIRSDEEIPALVEAFKVMLLGLTVVWAMEGPPWASHPGTTRNQVRLFCTGIEVKK